MVECNGYLKIVKGDKRECKKKTKPLLWIMHKKNKLHFCRSSHVIRYLVEHYGRQGGKKKQQSAQKEDEEDGN